MPPILLTALKHCSGQCLGLNIKGNATIDFLLDGKHRSAKKTDYTELIATMSNDTDFFFPIIKPAYPNDQYKFIQVISMGKVVQVEGKPMVNTIGQNVTSSLSSLVTILVIFFVLCWLAGCCIWALVRHFL